MKLKIFPVVLTLLAGMMMTSCDNAETLTTKGQEALAAGDAAKAAELFQKAADQQNAEATRVLGQLYAEGKGVEKSAEKAVELYSKSNELGDTIASYLLAECYETGAGVKADFPKAIALYEHSDSMGYPAAAGKLAVTYFRGGKGVEVDWAKAAKYSEKAVPGGDADALAINGFFIATGQQGYAQDKEKGEKQLRSSVDKKSDLGKALLGYYILAYTDGGRRAEALKLVQESAAAGEPFGIAFTGYAHECGFLPASFGTAVKYYLDAADKGCVWALWRAGMVKVDLQYKKAEGHELIRRAAAAGDGEGLNRLGYSYLNGFSEEKSPEKAFETFMKGAEKGNAAAMSNVAYCYEEGQGVTADKQKAIEWYEKAVKYGDPYYSQQRLKALKK